MIEFKEHKEIVRLSVDIATKLGPLTIILYISYLIIRPFLPIIPWEAAHGTSAD